MAKIVLEITGSIAAYKGLMLYEALKQKHNVELVVTKSAKHFFNETPKSAHSKIFTQDYYKKTTPSQHITIAKDADLLVVYPASQHFLGQVANGLTDNLASLVYSAASCQKLVFPAMNTVMYLSPANQRNMQTLAMDGANLYEAKTGPLAAFEASGIGRAWEWEEVLQEINDVLSFQTNWKDKKVLLNFGRIKTYLDDIRYITNNSSGRMGDALHRTLINAKASVTTIVGDCDFLLPYKHIKVNTNQEMLEKMSSFFDDQDVVIACAALNDFQVKNKMSGKISKRNHASLSITLEKNVDVLKALGEKKQNQILVGFSAQNDFDIDYGRRKLIEKNLDLIVINTISAMGSDQNEVILLTKNDAKKVPVQSKNIIAKHILTTIETLLEERKK